MNRYTTMVRMMPSAAQAKKAPCQLKFWMTGTIRIGPSAGPRNAPAFISEFALPRSRVGNHLAKNAAEAGKTGAWPAREREPDDGEHE